MPDELDLASKQPPYIFCNRCCDSKNACEVFICANILFHVLQIVGHIQTWATAETEYTQSLNSLAEFLFFFTEWGLAFLALYGLRKNSYMKVMPYYVWAIFETFMQILFFIYIVHMVATYHEPIHSKLEELHQEKLEHAAQNPNNTIHQDIADQIGEWKEVQHSNYVAWAFIVCVVQACIIALGIFEVHCLKTHREYLIKTFGREPINGVLCFA